MPLTHTPHRRLLRWLITATLYLGLSGCVPVMATDHPEPHVRVDRHVTDMALPLGHSAQLTFSLVNDTTGPAAVTLSATDSWLRIDAPVELAVPENGASSFTAEVTCGDVAMVRHGWVLIADAAAEQAVSVRVICTAAGEMLPSDDETLNRLEPPVLERPSVIRISREPARRVLSLEANRDYLVLFPDQPIEHGVVLEGGRNVVVMGGEIRIPWQGESASIASRRGMRITKATGTVHVEGLLMHGPDISEGIQISSPRAVVQLQSVAVLGLQARDQIDFTDNHPDIVQTYGNVGHLKVDRLTGSTDYQGLFLVADLNGPAHGPVDLSRVNIVGAPTARYLLWFSGEPRSGRITLDDVWVDVPSERSGGLGRAVWPDVRAPESRRAMVERHGGLTVASWPAEKRPEVIGVVHGGRPPNGDFVRVADIGVGYRSPGYVFGEAE